jgi:hypothetical protein
MNLDQFYTSEELARSCFEKVKSYGNEGSIWLEPSAGTGAFYSLFSEKRVGYDLEPKYSEIETADFMLVDLNFLKTEDVITVGNPPFGKNSALAVKFFNRCAEVSRIIAMILPRTFRKPSIINRLDKSYHLVLDDTIPAFSFIADGQPYDVPCCFQIWARRDTLREKIDTPTTHEDFSFCKREQGDFAVQRVGVNAGRVKDISDKIADPSHYYIKDLVGGVRGIMEGLNFDGVKFETAGNPSVSKGDLINLYKKCKIPDTSK